MNKAAANSQLVIDVNPQNREARIALLEDSRLVEYRTQKKDAAFTVGDIYVGVVHRVMQNHNAAFVDIGHKREGFLHYKDIGPHFKYTLDRVRQITRRGRRPAQSPDDLLKLFAPPQVGKDGDDGRPAKGGKITEYLKTGQLLLVQVAREPYGSKGPSLTTEITLAGRNMVLYPQNDHLLISNKITAKEENERLRRVFRSILPAGFGAIIRTAAEGKGVGVLHPELEELVSRWRSCLVQLQETRKFPARLLSEISGSSAFLRDNLDGSFSSIVVNDQELYEQIRSYMQSVAPKAEELVKLYSSKRVPIFDQYDVTKQVKRLLGRTVDFHKGSYLIIQHTEALHVIDVNSGRGSRGASSPEDTAFEVNYAACDEIARQLRLRDMGGIIVIDFIDMTSRENQQKIFEHMRQLMSTDRVTHKILPLTAFGLMQITRQRFRPEQRVDISERCPTCNGTGKMEGSSVQLEDEIKRKLAVISERKLYKNLELRVHPYLAAYLQIGFISRRRRITQQYGIKLRVQAISSYAMLQFSFHDSQGDEITF